MSIVHVTPTVLDVRAFTVFGLSAKPNSKSPIGKFGTGLKYAVATLVRLGCRVQVFIDGTEYEFYTSKGEFRGIEFQQLRMKQRRGVLSKWRSVELPYTTEHGKFWKAWQAFRELESNTRDEDGDTLERVIESTSDYLERDSKGKTIIIVTGEPYEDAWQLRDQTFLPDALTSRDGDTKVQIFNEQADHVYWRGIRVMDIDKPSMYTYNILSDLELTEDRTIKYTFNAMSAIAGFVARSNDERLISAVVSADKDKHFEGRLDFDYAYETPSAAFLRVIAKKRARGGYVSSGALGYYGRYSLSVSTAPATLREKIELHAYDAGLPTEVQELLKYILKCEITEPEDDSEVPY